MLNQVPEAASAIMVETVKSEENIESQFTITTFCDTGEPSTDDVYTHSSPPTHHPRAMLPVLQHYDSGRDADAFTSPSLQFTTTTSTFLAASSFSSHALQASSVVGTLSQDRCCDIEEEKESIHPRLSFDVGEKNVHACSINSFKQCLPNIPLLPSNDVGGSSEGGEAMSDIIDDEEEEQHQHVKLFFNVRDRKPFGPATPRLSPPRGGSATVTRTSINVSKRPPTPPMRKNIVEVDTSTIIRGTTSRVKTAVLVSGARNPRTRKGILLHSQKYSPSLTYSAVQQRRPKSNTSLFVFKKVLVLGMRGVLLHEEVDIGRKCKPCEQINQQHPSLEYRPPDAQLAVTPSGAPSETINVYYRPHIAHFIRTVAQHFDIAIFSVGEQDYVDALLDVMDPSGQVFPKSRRYYRQHCTKVVSHQTSDASARRSATFLAKDLQILGRPLNEVVLIDDIASSGFLQPSNLMLVPTWRGDPSDTALLQLAKHLVCSLSDKAT